VRISMGAAAAAAAISARIYRGSSSHECAYRVITMITRNPSWRSGDPLVKPYPTPPHPRPHANRSLRQAGVGIIPRSPPHPTPIRSVGLSSLLLLNTFYLSLYYRFFFRSFFRIISSYFISS